MYSRNLKSNSDLIIGILMLILCYQSHDRHVASRSPRPRRLDDRHGIRRSVLHHGKGKVSSLRLLAIIWTASSDAAQPRRGEPEAARQEMLKL
jgi:hypothetical protein